MPGLWMLSNTPAANTAATVTQAAPAGGAVNRLRAFTATLSGSATGSDQFVVRDGPSGTGTIIYSAKLRCLANGMAVVQESDLDLRASVGNALTCEFVNGGGANTDEVVSAQGDIVPSGYPPFQA